jgi:hypothetical protein
MQGEIRDAKSVIGLARVATLDAVRQRPPGNP